MGSYAKINEPFTGYNKANPDGALVGNWVEERVLHATTGRHRLGVGCTTHTRGQSCLVYSLKLSFKKMSEATLW